MLKGINRNVIVVKGNGRSRFETVCFIMKKGCSAGKKELADEAQRLIGESGYLTSRTERSAKRLRAALFLFGFAAGAAAVSLAWAVLAVF